jgi:hypothetical protein
VSPVRKKRTALEKVEEEHGFIFGLPDEHDDAGARVLKHVKCETPGCDRASPQHPPQPVHEDTQQPVLCGGCGAPLVCDHELVDEVEEPGGTLAEPVTYYRRVCHACHAVLEERVVQREPMRLEDLPVSVLADLGVPLSPPVS